MNPVNNEVQLFSQPGLGFVVKNVSVDEVLDQRPEQNAEHKQRLRLRSTNADATSDR